MKVDRWIASQEQKLGRPLTDVEVGVCTFAMESTPGGKRKKLVAASKALYKVIRDEEEAARQT